jgi:tetratricopeptide (TPR) repeat protein
LNLIEGETHYELLGQIYNGLGIVYEARNLYEEATRYYKNALGYSSLARNVYGIQAAYFNIGNMHSKFGDVALYSAKTGISLVAKDNYNTSITWVRRCMELCKRAGIGGDTCQDRILLAYCWYKLRNFREALKYATEAVKIATRVGNKRDRRIAQRLLEDITSEMRMKDKG